MCDVSRLLYPAWSHNLLLFRISYYFGAYSRPLYLLVFVLTAVYSYLNPVPRFVSFLFQFRMLAGVFFLQLCVVSADIVSACFALPFERRLVLGTEDGRILLVNYVTGAILDESHPHAAEVSDMLLRYLLICFGIHYY